MRQTSLMNETCIEKRAATESIAAE